MLSKYLQAARQLLLPPLAPSSDEDLTTNRVLRERFQSWGVWDYAADGAPRVLLASGFGYGNVGDEAQLGACIGRWRRIAPNAQITLLSPSPHYTAALHGERVEWAPRVAWFRSNTRGPYSDNPRFRRHFRMLRARLEVSARTLRADLPISFLRPREARILSLIQEHDVLHISGGGFLTGKTKTRLWDHALLMRACQLLGKPYFLTGHNIGVFQCRQDRRIAFLGLKKAKSIGLRDRGRSESELREIGISGAHVSSTCDDALFCERVPSSTVRQRLSAAGMTDSEQWVAVNFHHWGQDEMERPSIQARFAQLCDHLWERHGMRTVFVAMTPEDVVPEELVARRMAHSPVILPYCPDYRLVRGVIADAALVFTMKHHPIVFAQGESVPAVSVALDPYYLHKNVGAMENTGHSNFVADRGTFFSSAAEALLDQAVAESSSISLAMKAWTDQMREIELNPYQAIIQALGIGSVTSRRL